MKKECNIVRDLMVLYELENCSIESIQMIEKHIEECEECRKIWESKTKGIVEKVVEETKTKDGKEEFDKLRKKIRRKNIIKIIVITCILAFGINKGYRFVKDPVVTEYEDMEITNIYKADGKIGFKVTLTDGRGFGEHRGYYSDGGAGVMGVEVYRSRFAKDSEEESEISYYVSVPNDKTKEVYYHDDDGDVLIWQEGDPISELTDEIKKDMERVGVSWE